MASATGLPRLTVFGDSKVIIEWLNTSARLQVLELEHWGACFLVLKDTFHHFVCSTSTGSITCWLMVCVKRHWLMILGSSPSRNLWKGNSYTHPLLGLSSFRMYFLRKHWFIMIYLCFDDL